MNLKLEYKLLVAEGLTTGQIGRMYEVSRQSVWGVMNRGRQQFRQNLYRAKHKKYPKAQYKGSMLAFRQKLYSCGIKGEAHKKAVEEYLACQK